MVIANLFCATALIWAFFYDHTPRRQRKLLLVMLAVTLILFVGTTTNYSDDVLSYAYKYIAVRTMTFQQIWQDGMAGRMKDPGFFQFMLLCNKAGLSFQMFFLILAAAYIIPVCVLIGRESKNGVLSCLMLVSLSWISFISSGLRQSLAMSLCCTAMLIQLKKRNSLLPLLFIGIAYFCHASASVFIIAYIILRLNIKISSKVFYWVVGASVLMTVLGETLLRRMVLFVAMNSRFEGYSTRELALNWSGFIIQLGILALCSFGYKVAAERNPNYQSLFTIATTGLVFQSFSSTIAECFRISLYFSIVDVVLLPMCVVSYDRRTGNKQMQLFAICLFLLYYFVSPKYTGYASFLFNW